MEYYLLKDIKKISNGMAIDINTILQQRYQKAVEKKKKKHARPDDSGIASIAGIALDPAAAPLEPKWEPKWINGGCEWWAPVTL